MEEIDLSAEDGFRLGFGVQRRDDSSNVESFGYFDHMFRPVVYQVSMDGSEKEIT